MQLRCEPSTLSGGVEIPGSKSHTIRAVAIAALADGELSYVREPLESADTRCALNAYKALGAVVSETPGVWRIGGVAGEVQIPDQEINVGNSGTTLNIALGSCALLREGRAVLTGDAQIQRRASAQLARSLNDLGAQVTDMRGTGCAPFEVRGRLRGGETSLEAVSSQYLTSLLMSTPLSDGDSRIRVPLLNERPYVAITLDWLTRQGIRFEAADDWSVFDVPGGQRFAPVRRRMPGDFSSATFFLAAGALPGNAIVCRGLDYSDTQGDKAVVDYLKAMGADVQIGSEEIRVTSRDLRGCEIDLNATPDALPMMAVLACFAQGETRLMNVPQARQKETDRIAVMREELAKLGADVEELEDGLVVRESRLVGTTVDSHDDHRVVMALAIAGTHAKGITTIERAEAMNVTYPAFVSSLRDLGGRAEELADAPQGTRA
jgi:3-phosphoshikimate 1-carboxyvinyltransferase